MDLEKFKNKLESEKRKLVGELDMIGVRKDPKQENWEAVADDRSELMSRDEMADRYEDIENRQATEIELEARLKSVNKALEKIDSGNYGKCEVGGEEIEEERLEANPAARTCKAHLNEEEKLN